MTKVGFAVDVPASAEAKVFINALEACTWRSRRWLLKNGKKILEATRNAEGCFAFYPARLGVFKTLLVSYWRSEEDLMCFLKTDLHHQWVRYFYQHSDDFVLMNEFYDVTRSGHYHGEKMGLAAHFKIQE